MEVVLFAIALVLGVVLPLAVQLWDRERMTERERRRVWNTATWGSSLLWLGPLTLLGWGWVTRRTYKRYLWGPVWLGIVFSMIHTIDIFIYAAFDESLDGWWEGYLLGVAAVPVGVVILGVIDVITRGYRGVRRWLSALTVVTLVMMMSSQAQALERFPFHRDAPLPPGHAGWRHAAVGGIRGITVGPIENKLHPDGGYGTAKGRAAIEEAGQMGATWVAITPFGRVWDLSGGGVDLMFEADPEQNARDVLTAIEDAHRAGLRVMLVPHLWVETGGWRAQIDPPTDAGWKRWAASYRRFLLHWAEIAERGQVEILSVGVELRSWVTTPRAPSFSAIIDDVRARYGGLLTYSGNWDDVEHTVILGELDLIGVNAFYPLTTKTGDHYPTLRRGGIAVADRLENLATAWDRPILLTEMGYTTRPDPALRPWEWPDAMENVVVDQRAQAKAYRALLTPLLDRNWFAGFFVWRTYADPGDVSQEQEWGFSPRGKLAELEMRDAFAARWASDPHDLWASWIGIHRARTPGRYAWELSPSLASFIVH